MAWVEDMLLIQFVIRHGGYPIAHSEALRLSNLENMVTGLVRLGSTFFSIMSSILNFAVAFQKKARLVFRRRKAGRYCR